MAADLKKSIAAQIFKEKTEKELELAAKIQQELLPKENESDAAREARIEKREKFEKQNALLVIQLIGAGRVLMMNTDRTWRFRYRIGDPYHHRFWGQVLRWATAKKLQAGTQFVQIGTDKPTYQVDEPVIVSAKITDSYFVPVDDKEAKINLFKGKKLVISKSLDQVDDAPGTFRVDLGKVADPGQYRIELLSPKAKKIFAGTADSSVETLISVAKPEIRSAEMSNPTADRDGLRRLTAMSGGAMVEADGRFEVLNFFNEGTKRYTEQKRYSLWDSWPMLILLIGLVATEWVLRKKGGLV